MKLKSMLGGQWFSAWQLPRAFKERIARALCVPVVATTFAVTNGLATAQDKQPYPVVLIPGILGSKLCSATGDVLWGGSAKNSLSNFHRLNLAVQKPEAVKACGIVESIQVLGPLYSIAAYSDLLETMKDWHFVAGRNLFIFDYDWRQSNVDTAAKLQKFIELKLGPNRKFNIVAHSMGGLVARLYLERTGAASRVNKVIYLGTPFLGSMNTLGTLSEGWGTIPNWIAGGVDGIRQTALSFPSMLELLPRYHDCCLLKKSNGQYSPVNFFDANVWKNSGWLPADLKQGAAFKRFSAQLKTASSLTPVLSSPPHGPGELLFASSSFDTRLVFTAKEGSTAPSPENWHFSMQPGDSTVPLGSAARDVQLMSGATALASFAQHSTIFDDRWVREELKRQLTNTAAVFDKPISAPGATTIKIEVNGQFSEWELHRMQISSSATYISGNSPIDAEVSLKFTDGARDFSKGHYKPVVSLRQNDRNIPMQVAEITTDADVDAQILKFKCHIDSTGFDDGVVELNVALPSSQPRSAAKKFLVVLR